MSRFLKGLLALCLLLAAAGTGIALRLYEEPREVEAIRPTSAPTTFPRLSAQLARSAGRLLVTNRDDHPWTACIVDINAGVWGGGYSRELGDLDPGREATLRLDAFARTDGRHFDPRAERVQVVDLHCETPTGPAHFSGGL